MRGLGALMFVVGVMMFLTLGIIRCVSAYNFSVECKQYLSRASTANTVEMATRELEPAIKYLEKHDMTNGVVSIFFHQPDNDIGFFYSNLVASREELKNLPPNATSLEKSNVLLKLRESLTNAGEKGTYINHPDGISIYPNNKLFFWLFVGFFLMALVGFFGSQEY